MVVKNYTLKNETNVNGYHFMIDSESINQLSSHTVNQPVNFQKNDRYVYQ